MKFRFSLFLTLSLAMPLVAHAQGSDLFLSESTTSTQTVSEQGEVKNEEHYGSYASEIRTKKKKAIAAMQYSGALAELPDIQKGMDKLENGGEEEEFKGPIERLLKAAGEDPKAAQNNWQDFESIAQDDQAKQNYFETAEWKMRRELSRPLAKRKTFGDRLSEVEMSIGNLNTKQKDLDQQYGEKSKWAPGR